MQEQPFAPVVEVPLLEGAEARLLDVAQVLQARREQQQAGKQRESRTSFALAPV